MIKLTTIICLLLVGPNMATQAQLRLPALISDNMVLQQDADVSLWGWATPGATVQVQPSWQKKELLALVKADSSWQLLVHVPKAGAVKHELRFIAGDTLTVRNVVAGEVWLASGQSNMEFYVGKGEGWRTGVQDYETEIPRADFPLIRMIDVPNTVAGTPAADFAGAWQICSPATVAGFSAVAYYFARSVQAATGYPVGIINATWGGTPAESWTPKPVLEADSGFRAILARYEQRCAAYPAKYEEYREKLTAWKADTTKGKKGAPREPIGPNHNKSPYKLYNGMIAPLRSYALKGVIWYQGESNADYAWQYRRLFPALIASWREAWHAPGLPFYFVQIAPHKGQNPVIREAQSYAWQTTAHTGMVVTTDVGNANDIHPRNKKTVGDRLALWALHDLYHKKKLEPSGPVYRDFKRENGRMVLQFTHAGGLHVSGDTLKEFRIAGADRNFVDAHAQVRNGRVEVWSEQVPDPVAVRFAWKNVPEPNLFNAAGLPAIPFRTDDWPVETQGKE